MEIGNLKIQNKTKFWKLQSVITVVECKGNKMEKNKNGKGKGRRMCTIAHNGRMKTRKKNEKRMIGEWKWGCGVVFFSWGLCSNNNNRKKSNKEF